MPAWHVTGQLLYFVFEKYEVWRQTEFASLRIRLCDAFSESKRDRKFLEQGFFCQEYKALSCFRMVFGVIRVH
jgi:hypothetical protein